MLVYRIVLEKFANELSGSGRAARWNPNDIEIVYTTSSRSLACLENIVNRDQLGLNQVFSVMTIACPDDLAITAIRLNDLPDNWSDYNQMVITQKMGETWIKENRTPILSVPSSIINDEVNYLLNPKHADFNKIKLVDVHPFTFDRRIKK
jgi:RES domain-containing protein